MQGGYDMNKMQPGPSSRANKIFLLGSEPLALLCTAELYDFFYLLTISAL